MTHLHKPTLHAILNVGLDWELSHHVTFMKVYEGPHFKLQIEGEMWLTRGQIEEEKKSKDKKIGHFPIKVKGSLVVYFPD